MRRRLRQYLQVFKVNSLRQIPTHTRVQGSSFLRSLVVIFGAVLREWPSKIQERTQIWTAPRYSMFLMLWPWSREAEGVFSVATDISNKDEIKVLVDRVSSKEPNGIQLLVNNAGIAKDYATEFAGNPAPNFQDPVAISEHFWKSDPVSWQQNFTTNCMGGYFMSIAFLPLLARGCDVIPGYTSSIVNVTSNSAFLKNTTRGHISYGASKAGSGPDQKSKLTRAVTNAVGRPGHEIDMAATILLLAGRGGTFYTAQTLFPDGGETLIEAASV
ncbi:MAG: hypothetical protein Q9222_003530 [Ikaeria aurantiellina]